MSRSHPVPTEQVRYELTVKGSRFIATMGRVRSAEEATAFINAIKTEFPDASHNCSAFNAGTPGDTKNVGMSDDGEPSGTAGRPMLTTLLHSGIGEIAVVVTRYFGGTKLGKGGLVRAYTQAVQGALKKLPTAQLRNWTAFILRCDYPDLEKTKMVIDQLDGEIERVTYEAEITLDTRIPEENAEEFVEEFRQTTCGRGQFVENKG